MTADRPVWERTLLNSVGDGARLNVESVLSTGSARETFLHWMDRYAAAELARPCEDIVDAHEFGGHLRPLFARQQARPDSAFLSHCLGLFRLRRAWAKEHLHHGYCDGHEVHHQPETFLYFQIPLLDCTGDAEVLASIEDVASMAGNWAEGIPEWYDWKRHGFRSTWLGSREVHASHPDDYQEANHWRVISIVLAAHRHGAGGGRYLELACDYAERWIAHITQCVDAGETINMQILPAGGTLVEMGHAGVRKEAIPTGVYQVFYRLTAANTAYDVGQGLQDVYRLTGDDRCLDAAAAILRQYREHLDPRTGRWPVCCSQGRWGLGLALKPDQMPVGHGSSLLARLALRQLALQSDATLQQDLLRWADAAMVGDEALDGGTADLLLCAFIASGNERYRMEGIRRLTAGLAAVFGNADHYHCCSTNNREGYGYHLDLPWLTEAGLVESGTRGSWPFGG